MANTTNTSSPINSPRIANDRTTRSSRLVAVALLVMVFISGSRRTGQTRPDSQSAPRRPSLKRGDRLEAAAVTRSNRRGRKFFFDRRARGGPDSGGQRSIGKKAAHPLRRVSDVGFGPHLTFHIRPV